MAVAEKKAQEISTSSLFDRVAVVSLLGVIYVLGCLAVVFKLIPELWRRAWGGFGLDAGSFTGVTLQALIMLAAAGGLVLAGNRLFGSRQLPGIRAGIFCGLLFALTVLFLSRLVSLVIEHFVYDNGWFDDLGRTIGAVATAVVAAGLLLLFLRWFLRPGFERFLVRFESQGWFSAVAYKPQQGQKVRRGTILGILILFGAGIYTMVSHEVLKRGSDNWEVGIPFTGVMKDIAPNDAREDLNKENSKYPKWQTEGIPAYEFRKLAADYDKNQYVRINTTQTAIVVRDEDGKEHTFKKDDKVRRSDLSTLKKNLRDFYKEQLLDADEAKKLGKPTSEVHVVPVSPPTGRVQQASIVLLPHIRFTLPFVLLVLSLWFAWRVVNLPVFADFLIATEAELNKVSWTTRRRLWQDTIVVLTTMLLLAGLLFTMDQVWLHLLSWDRIGVIYQDKTPPAPSKGDRPQW